MASPLEPAPAVLVESVARTGAGTPLIVPILVTNTAAEPRVLAVTALGVDAAWLPLPVRTRPVMPGASEIVELTIVPAVGTLPARYPMTIAVQALDPVDQAAASLTELAELTLVVDAPGEVTVEVRPLHIVGVFGKRLSVLLSNSSRQPAEVAIDVQAPASANLSIDSDVVTVPPGETLKVPGRVRFRPRLVGQRVRYSYSITARGAGLSRPAEGSVTSRPVLGSSAAKAAALLAVVALWVGLAIVAIPKLADRVRNNQAGSSNQTISSTTAPSASAGAGGAGGSGGAGSSGGAGGGAGGAGGAANPADAGTVRLNGTVDGAAPGGVQVALRPTSLVDEEAEGATTLGVPARLTEARGMIAASSVQLTAPSTVTPDRSTVTQEDGAWSFPAIPTPGYYLLVFAKPGYQTQRYVINSAEADATQPLKVTLGAGQGHLSGTVAGPNGPVGGAAISITDGVNTLTTSTSSTGAVGQWTVEGLSTPSTYLVSVTKDGLGTESGLVTLGAGGSASVPLTLRSGVASLTGLIQGIDDLGALVGLGGVTVTATDGTTTRTATTVTQGPVGRYTLPGLPAPGTYTVTVTADGYQSQTQEIAIGAGQSAAAVGATLTRSTAVLTGKVTDQAGVEQEGAGVILTNPSNTYKTLSGAGGQFRINGVLPGTYVMSVDLFGYMTAYATVTLTAGQASDVPISLVFLGANALPSTAQIRVLGLMDATTNGPITCGPAPGGGLQTNCPVTFVTDPGTASPHTDPFQTGDIDANGYVVPTVPPGAVIPFNLLQPGLHHLQVVIAGYESVTVAVQVPIGATTAPTVTATVPTIALYPQPKLVGTINAVVGRPTGLTVRATEVGGHGFAAVSAPVSDVDGTYTLQVPEHGTYQIEVIAPAGSEYRSIAATPVTFGLGEVKRYDATIHRLGRIDITVLTPDPSTGALVSAGAVNVAITGPTPSTVTTSAAGVVTVTHLSAGLYRAQVQGGSQPALPAAGLVVGDDQEPPLTLVRINSLNQFVGRVISTVTGATAGVANAHVRVSGIVGYSGTTPIVNTVDLTTGANGCFAVTATGAAPNDIGACTGVSGAAVQALALVTGQASISVEAGFYNNVVLSNQAVSSSSLLNVVLSPFPSTFSGTLTALPSVPANLGSATVLVSRPAAGAGQVSISVAANGALTWLDSTYGVANAAWPGTYQITATLPGYAPATATVACPLGGACTVSTFALQQLGTLVVQAAAPGGALVPGATFTLSGNGSTPQLQTAPPGGTSVTFSGISPAPSPGYVVRVQAAGYAFADTTTLTVTCTGGPSATALQVSPGGTTTCTINLGRLGAIVGTVRGVLGDANNPGASPTQPLGNVLLVAHPCIAGGATAAAACATVDAAVTFSAVSAVNGSYRIAGTADQQGLTAGFWQVSATLSGYTSPTPVNVQVAAGDVTQDLYLGVERVTLRVGVQNSPSNAPADLVTDATVKLVDSNGTTISPGAGANPDGTSHLYGFAALIPTTYSLQVTGATIGTVNLQVVLTVGVAIQTVYIRTDISASTVSGTVSAVQGASPAASPLAGATVSLGTGTGAGFVVATGTDGNPLTANTDAAGGNVAGYFSFSTVKDGTYVVQVTRTGYATQEQSVTVTHGQAVTPLAFTLSRVSHGVTVSVTSTNGFTLVGTSVTLTPNGSNPTLASQPLASAGGNVYSTTFNQVPNGQWTISFGFGTGGNLHFGTVTPVAPTTGLTVQVSGSPTGGDSTATFSLTEGQLNLGVTLVPNSTDTPPATVALTVTRSGATAPFYTNPAFLTTGATTSIWVAADTYAIVATPPPANGPAWVANAPPLSVAVASSSTPASGTVSLKEQPSRLTVNVTQAGAALTTQAKLTLTPQSGQTVPTTPIDYSAGVTTVGGTYTFTGLPPGTWKVTATIGTKTMDSTVITLLPGAANHNGGATPTTIDVPA